MNGDHVVDDTVPSSVGASALQCWLGLVAGLKLEYLPNCCAAPADGGVESLMEIRA